MGCGDTAWAPDSQALGVGSSRAWAKTLRCKVVFQAGEVCQTASPASFFPPSRPQIRRVIQDRVYPGFDTMAPDRFQADVDGWTGGDRPRLQGACVS